MISKTKLMATLKDMPEKFEVDEIIDKIILLNKIEVAKKQFKNGEIYSNDEVKQKIENWFK